VPGLAQRYSRKAIECFVVAIHLTIFSVFAFSARLTAGEQLLCLFILLVVAAGNLALAASAGEDIRRARGALRGDWMTTFGAITGPVCVAVGLFLPPNGYLFPQGCRAPNTQVANNLRQIALAMNSFHQQNGHFPGAAIRGPDGRPLLSWRVAILPYIEAEDLYKQFRLDEPWDSPHNLALLPKMDATYTDPDHDRSDGLTRFQVYAGPGSAFEAPRPHNLAEFVNGPDKTLLVTEGEQRVPWTKPMDLPFGPDVILVRPFERYRGNRPAFLAVAADACCHIVATATPEETLRALITRNGNKKADWP
jgi:hypothetical protein